MNEPIEKIKSLVSESGTQRAAAEILGISQVYLSDILNGRRFVSDELARRLGYRRIICFEQLPGPADSDRPILVEGQK
jgi:antitoxin component HigA of HigAB toxin-antitoxin module